MSDEENKKRDRTEEEAETSKEPPQKQVKREDSEPASASPAYEGKATEEEEASATNDPIKKEDNEEDEDESKEPDENSEELKIVVDRKAKEESENGEDKSPEKETVDKSEPATKQVNTKAEGLPDGVPNVVQNQPAPAPVSNDPDSPITDSMEVFHNVGKIIGRGGEMIRDLQARSGIKIDVDQSGAKKIVTFQGPRRKIEFAKQLIDMLIVQGKTESDLPLGEAMKDTLVISHRAVGKIIGQGGDMIRELQSRSMAKIQVDHSNANGLGPDDKLVIFLGKPEAVIKAKEMVMFLAANLAMDAATSLSMLVEDKKTTGSPWGTGPPYPNLPNQGIDMQPNGMQSSYSAPAPQLQYQQQSYYGGSNFQGSSYPQQPQMQHQPAYGASFGGPEQDVIFISKNVTGRIIGKGGVTINDLQRRSGSNIQLNQNVPAGQDIPVTIKGSRPSIEHAKQMISEIIATGPSHPYAGGAGGGVAAMASTPAYMPTQSYQQPSYGAYNPHAQPPQAYGQPYGTGPPMGGAVASSYYGQQHSQPAPITYAAPPAALPPAPSVWKTATAPNGQTYYYNEFTHETTWEKPPGMP